MIYDDLKAMQIKLQSWTDLQEEGLDYDARTTYCPWCEENPEDCDHDPSEYNDQTKERNALERIDEIIAAIKNALPYFEV